MGKTEHCIYGVYIKSGLNLMKCERPRLIECHHILQPITFEFSISSIILAVKEVSVSFMSQEMFRPVDSGACG